mmetsp:Transcript_139989/g.363846  ORF Transcript_139989/g.363846 Transcript_139989/m.363846 type:complete len:250 (-) Transcript_139989:337-1086(-)
MAARRRWRRQRRQRRRCGAGRGPPPPPLRRPLSALPLRSLRRRGGLRKWHLHDLPLPRGARSHRSGGGRLGRGEQVALRPCLEAVQLRPLRHRTGAQPPRPRLQLARLRLVAPDVACGGPSPEGVPACPAGPPWQQLPRRRVLFLGLRPAFRRRRPLFGRHRAAAPAVPRRLSALRLALVAGPGHPRWRPWPPRWLGRRRCFCWDGGRKLLVGVVAFPHIDLPGWRGIPDRLAAGDGRVAPVGANARLC